MMGQKPEATPLDSNFRQDHVDAFVVPKSGTAGFSVPNDDFEEDDDDEDDQSEGNEQDSEEYGSEDSAGNGRNKKKSYR